MRNRANTKIRRTGIWLYRPLIDSALKDIQMFYPDEKFDEISVTGVSRVLAYSFVIRRSLGDERKSFVVFGGKCHEASDWHLPHLQPGHRRWF